MVGISHQLTRLSNRKSEGKRLFHTFQVLVKLAFLQGTSNGCESSHRKNLLHWRGKNKLQHKRPTPKDHLSSLRKKRPLSLPLFYGVTKLTHSMSSLTFVRCDCFASLPFAVAHCSEWHCFLSEAQESVTIWFFTMHSLTLDTFLRWEKSHRMR